MQDKATDVYKLGLAILRCLNPGKGAATMRDPSRVAGKLDAGRGRSDRARGGPGPGPAADRERAVRLPARCRRLARSRRLR